MEPVACVYKISHIEHPEKFYIGSTVNLKRRWYTHLKSFSPDSDQQTILAKAFRKYGLENFIVEIVEECHPDRETLLAREQHYLDTLRPPYNMNTDATSPLGCKASDEARAKISKGLKRWHAAHPEYGDTIRKRWLGRKHTPESIERMKGGNQTSFKKGVAQPRSKEHAKKLSDAKRGKPFADKHLAAIRAYWEKTGRWRPGLCENFGPNRMKLNEDQVKDILLDDRKVSVIAREYGVCESTIRAILTGHTWKQVPRP